MPVPRGLPSVAADEGTGLAIEDRQGVACFPFLLLRSARPSPPALSPEGRGGRSPGLLMASPDHALARCGCFILFGAFLHWTRRVAAPVPGFANGCT